MSHADRKSSIGAESTTGNTPNMPNGKASAVAPKLSDDDHVELADMLPTGPAIAPEEDIMQLARLGDIQAIEKLYDSEKFDATYCDAEGITPLHVLCPVTTRLRI
jgi:palmitoyltransferase ZDHHC13/17